VRYRRLRYHPKVFFSKAVLASFLFAAALAAQQIEVKVDATDAPRRLFHVQMTIPASPGPMTLDYPKWIPGEHMPSGPITNMVGLRIAGGGRAIPWKRDDVNMFAFHIDVPSGVTSLAVTFDYIAPPEGGSFSAGGSTTTELAVLNWNQLVLYPEGAQPDQLQVKASLRVPAGWRYGTALPISRETGNEIEFQPAGLTTVIDSPLSMGRHYRTVDLGTSGNIAHFMHIAADSDRATEITPTQVASFKNLVTEAGALFGARHYRSYHFLYTLSDHTPSFGLEHHESSDDRQAERALIDPAQLKAFGYLLPHEMVHSWNGKYRRPAGLATGGYEQPMKGDLLWVYEGLTNYLGEVLAARSGLWTPEDYREQMAMTAASLDKQSGRAWRPLEDTAVAAQLLYEAGDDFSDYRRGVDYYPEGSLIWLEADVKIRQLSNDAKSLNDFCRLFHGGDSGKPELKPYTLDDVVKALNTVQPFDWAGFFRDRVQSLAPRAPLGGITGGGWKLVYDSTRSEFWGAVEEFRKATDLSYSIGLKVKDDGTIVDVVLGGPAQKAGITPSTKIIAVNRKQFTAIGLRETVQKTATGGKLELLVKSGDYYESHAVDYSGGERFPHLVRADSKDLMTEITAPSVPR
jgi:predicted metalloprotease with PDZ domain